MQKIDKKDSVVGIYINAAFHFDEERFYLKFCIFFFGYIQFVVYFLVLLFSFFEFVYILDEVFLYFGKNAFFANSFLS